jgi:hypothetical protein
MPSHDCRSCLRTCAYRCAAAAASEVPLSDVKELVKPPRLGWHCPGNVFELELREASGVRRDQGLQTGITFVLTEWLLWSPGSTLPWPWPWGGGLWRPRPQHGRPNRISDGKEAAGGGTTRAPSPTRAKRIRSAASSPACLVATRQQLLDVLTRLDSTPADQVDTLLPQNWAVLAP